MTKTNEDRENNIDEAIQKIQNGLAVAVASRYYRIPQMTLHDRLRGAQPIRVAKENAQKLSQVQEQDLIQWIKSEEACGRAPNRRRIRSFAQLILTQGGSDQHLGQHWVDRFFERNEEVKMKVSRGIEASRTIHTTEGVIRSFWDRLDDEIKAKSVSMNRIYNLDETGLAEGETRSGKVAGTSLTTAATVTESDSREWVTIIECVSAAGDRVKPYVIYTGKTVQQQWFPDEIPDWAYDSSPTGWANAGILFK
ncbi:MFS-type transporter clz9-like protein [Cladobotryum mycophilum]|uniref:MFS-type transporter clz9-like protein n=1 Tax=Cladobotryum mycophilum TaxID=491253 RepID=A0ABR0SBP7_9HYPO